MCAHNRYPFGALWPVGLSLVMLFALSQGARASSDQAEPAPASQAASQPSTAPVSPAGAVVPPQSVDADRTWLGRQSQEKDKPHGGLLTDGNRAGSSELVGKMLAMVAVIIVLGVAGVVVVKKVLPGLQGRRGGGKTVCLLETVYLGPGKSLHLLAVGERRLLVASSKDQISMLADLTAQPQGQEEQLT